MDEKEIEALRAENEALHNSLTRMQSQLEQLSSEVVEHRQQDLVRKATEQRTEQPVELPKTLKDYSKLPIKAKAKIIERFGLSAVEHLPRERVATAEEKMSALRRRNALLDPVRAAKLK